MDTKYFSITFLGQEKDVIQISFLPGISVQKVLPALCSFFSSELTKGISKWIIDFSNMPLPTTTMIAFIISATQQSREKGGDVKIISAKDSARNNLVTFSPLAYLSIEENSTHALNDFKIEIPPGKSDELEKADIMEPPVVEGIADIKSKIDQKPASKDTAGHIVKAKKYSRPPSKQITPNIQTTIDGKKKFYLKTESIASNLYKICDFIVEHSRQAGMEEKQIVKSKIAVYEACLNVIEHAYHSRPDNWIEVWVEYSEEKFQIVIQDHGISFEKSEPGEFDVEAAVEKRQTGGFGLHIIERSMDEVSYEADAVNGNQLKLIKYLKK